MFVAKYSCTAVSLGSIERADDVWVKDGDGTSYGSVVEVTCSAGYVKNPNVRQSTCTTSGTWDPPIPQCVGKQGSGCRFAQIQEFRSVFPQPSIA